MMSIWNAIGTFGAIAIITAYGLLQLRIWQPEDQSYSGTNALGACMILISLGVEPNVPSIFIEAFWLLISLAGLLRAKHDRGGILPKDKG